MDYDKNAEVIVSTPIKMERFLDLFVGACEGGSSYWADEIDNNDKTLDPYEGMFKGFTVLDREGGSQCKKSGEWIPKKIVVTEKMVRDAMMSFAEKEPWHFSNLMREQDDSETADVFLQLCVFGKSIYG